MLALFPGIKLNLVSPPNLKMPVEVVEEVKQKGTLTGIGLLCLLSVAHVAIAGITVVETQDLNSVLKHTDVLYQTRVQKERFTSLEEYERSKGSYIITPQTLAHAKKVLPTASASS